MSVKSGSGRNSKCIQQPETKVAGKSRPAFLRILLNHYWAMLPILGAILPGNALPEPPRGLS